MPPKNADPPEIATLLYFSKNSLCLIGGDFNSHHRIWENSRVNNKCGLSFAQYIKSNTYITLCTPYNLPTRIDPSSDQPPTIDLTFVSTNLAHLTLISLGPPTGDIDHVPID